MTHLILKQTTNSTEQVDSSCIDDLYKLTVDAALDNTSEIQGRINTATSTSKKVNTLHTLDNSNPPQPTLTDNLTRWDGLFVTATQYAISFKDPEVARILEGIVGHSLTSQDAANMTDGQVYNAFKNNSTILSFDELEYFTSLYRCPNFYKCTSLQSVTLPTSCTTLAGQTFYGCSSLESVNNTDRITEIQTEVFLNCTKLKTQISFPNLSNLYYNAFSKCCFTEVLSLGVIARLPLTCFLESQYLTKVALPSTCVRLDDRCLGYCPLLNDIDVQYVLTLGGNPMPGSPGPTILNYANLVSVTPSDGDSNQLGRLCSQLSRYLYAPKLTSTTGGFDNGYNSANGLFMHNGWGNTRSTFYIAYFRDLTTVKTGCFCGGNVKNLVINNTTPPSFQAWSGNSSGLLFSGINSGLSSIISNIYVPDSAVNTYKSDTYWGEMSSIIRPISELLIKPKLEWDSLSDTAKQDVLIQEYM